MKAGRRPGSVFASEWGLDPDTVFLNHGSFGACPSAVSRFRRLLLEEMEGRPVDFILRRYMSDLPSILGILERFTGAQRGSIALLPNTTTAISTVLSNISLKPGDELLTTGQEYFASRNALRLYARRSGATVVEAPLEVPADGPQDVLDAVMSRVSGHTVLVLVDHVSSPTGMVFPVEELAEALEGSGTDLLVDGAHGPGMLPLDLARLGAAYYAGNCHKWMCTPKTAAILYVRPDRQEGFHPAVVSHLASDFASDLSPFQVEFSWNGTIDPTPRMAIPFAVDFMEELHPGGWEGLMMENHEMVLRAVCNITGRTGLKTPCPPEMFGSMGSVMLPWKPPPEVPPPEGIDPLQQFLRQSGIEVPVTFTSTPPGRFLRFSCQLYNDDSQYSLLADMLRSRTPPD